MLLLNANTPQIKISWGLIMAAFRRNSSLFVTRGKAEIEDLTL
jgi:hypothetical protein